MPVRRSVAIVAACAIILALAMSLRGNRREEVVFLSVGQGDCALILSGGRAAMIDAGPEAAASRLVLPELRRRGVRRIDLLTLSHPDADHIAGLPEIARRVPIDSIAIPAYFKSHPDLVTTLRAAKIADRSVHWVAGPAEAKVGRFLVQMDVPDWNPEIPDNDGSLLVRASVSGLSVTFTGDAGFLEEIAMMRKGSWAADILKLGHHGSRFSTGDSWLDHVHPKLAIVSCGRDNSYGHPAQEILDKCEKRGIQVMRTDRQGTISVRPTGSSFTVGR